MIKKFSRRKFVKASLAGASGFILTAPNYIRAKDTYNKLNIAIVGAGGRGAGNLAGVSSENIVVLTYSLSFSVKLFFVKYGKDLLF